MGYRNRRLDNAFHMLICGLHRVLLVLQRHGRTRYTCSLPPTPNDHRGCRGRSQRKGSQGARAGDSIINACTLECEEHRDLSGALTDPCISAHFRGLGPDLRCRRCVGWSRYGGVPAVWGSWEYIQYLRIALSTSLELDRYSLKLLLPLQSS